MTSKSVSRLHQTDLRCDGSLFHARGPDVTKERSPNDDSVRGTATVIDSADLRPALTLAAADRVIRSTK